MVLARLQSQPPRAADIEGQHHDLSLPPTSFDGSEHAISSYSSALDEHSGVFLPPLTTFDTHAQPSPPMTFAGHTDSLPPSTTFDGHNYSLPSPPMAFDGHQPQSIDAVSCGCSAVGCPSGFESQELSPSSLVTCQTLSTLDAEMRSLHAEIDYTAEWLRVTTAVG